MVATDSCTLQGLQEAVQGVKVVAEMAYCDPMIICCTRS